MSGSRLKVGIDVRLAHWPGIGRYIEEIVTQMVADFPATDFVLFVNTAGPATLRPYSDLRLEQCLRAPNVRYVECPIVPFTLSEPYTLARAVYAAGVQVMHSPYINIPWLGRGTVPLVVTLHDFRHPDLALRASSPRTWAKRAYYETLTRLALARASRLICVSEFLANQVRGFRADLDERIEVIPHAASASFQPMPAGQAADEVARRFGLYGRYFLFVGTLKPHKNLLAAVQAMTQPDLPVDVQLAVAATLDVRYPEVEAAVKKLGLARRVRFLGHVEKAHLPALYGAARATVLPSSYESFGLPLVESMACGTPVIAAPLGSLREVGGTAVWYAAPNPQALGAAMCEAIFNDALHARRRAAGLKRANSFSWERSAAALQQIYQNAGRLKIQPGSSGNEITP